MHIGLDIEITRITHTGLYTYLWNIVEQLTRIDSPHQVTLFLHGYPWMEEPERVRLIGKKSPQVPLEYVWYDVPLDLLTDHSKGSRRNNPSWLRGIDQRVLFPLWKTLVNPGSRFVGELARVFRLAHRSLRSADRLGVDVFHHPVGLVFPLQEKANVITISDLIPVHFPHYYPDPWCNESFEKAGQMDLILTYSEFTKHDIAVTLGINEENVTVVPLAAHEQYRPIDNHDQIRAVRAKYDLLERPYILHIGSLEPRKNLTRLVEAFQMLKQEEPSLDHQLVLVGSKVSMFQPIFEAIRGLNLEDDVKWLGFVPFDDLPAVLNGADLFVFPSIHEGFGLPPLEAMACGTPVVSSNATSLPEVVGDAGLLFDPYRIKEMAEAMHRVLADRYLRASLRQKGLERARSFSWEKTVRATLAAYEMASSRFQTKGYTGARTKRVRVDGTRNYPHVRTRVIEQLTRQVEGE